MSKVDCLAIILAYATDEKTVYRKRKRSIWTKDWLKRRSVFGHGNLIKEFEMPSHLDYKNYLRMCPLTFGELLELITPFYREKIPTRLLRNKIQTCLKNFKLLHKESNHTTHDQRVCASACVAQTV